VGPLHEGRFLIGGKAADSDGTSRSTSSPIAKGRLTKVMGIFSQLWGLRKRRDTVVGIFMMGGKMR
jgi:hypothetical protein